MVARPSIVTDFKAQNAQFLQAARQNTQALERLRKQMRRTQQQGRTMGETLQQGLTSLVAVTFAATAGFAALIQKTTQSANDILTLSRATSMTVEGIQDMVAAFATVGIAAEDAHDFIQTFTESIGEAQQELDRKGVSTREQALFDLGFSEEDIRTSQDNLDAFIDDAIRRLQELPETKAQFVLGELGLPDQARRSLALQLDDGQTVRERGRSLVGEDFSKEELARLDTLFGELTVSAERLDRALKRFVLNNEDRIRRMISTYERVAPKLIDAFASLADAALNTTEKLLDFLNALGTKKDEKGQSQLTGEDVVGLLSLAVSGRMAGKLVRSGREAAGKLVRSGAGQRTREAEKKLSDRLPKHAQQFSRLVHSFFRPLATAGKKLLGPLSRIVAPLLRIVAPFTLLTPVIKALGGALLALLGGLVGIKAAIVAVGTIGIAAVADELFFDGAARKYLRRKIAGFWNDLFGEAAEEEKKPTKKPTKKKELPPWEGAPEPRDYTLDPPRKRDPFRQFLIDQQRDLYAEIKQLERFAEAAQKAAEGDEQALKFFKSQQERSLMTLQAATRQASRDIEFEQLSEVVKERNDQIIKDLEKQIVEADRLAEFADDPTLKNLKRRLALAQKQAATDQVLQETEYLQDKSFVEVLIKNQKADLALQLARQKRLSELQDDPEYLKLVDQIAQAASESQLSQLENQLRVFNNADSVRKRRLTALAQLDLQIAQAEDALKQLPSTREHRRSLEQIQAAHQLALTQEQIANFAAGAEGRHAQRTAQVQLDFLQRAEQAQWQLNHLHLDYFDIARSGLFDLVTGAKSLKQTALSFIERLYQKTTERFLDATLNQLFAARSGSPKPNPWLYHQSSSPGQLRVAAKPVVEAGAEPLAVHIDARGGDAASVHRAIDQAIPAIAAATEQLQLERMSTDPQATRRWRQGMQG